MKIFIVEDDVIFGKSILYYLSLNPENEISLFTNGKEAIAKRFENPDLIILDYNLPGMNGMEVMQNLHNFNKNFSIIIISAQSDIRIAVNLLKEGAFDYIVKDQELKDRLWMSMEKIRKLNSYEKKIVQLEAEIEKKFLINNLLVGNSSSLKSIFTFIEKATKTNINVSITGETGTGKDLVAKAIHYNSDRKGEPFVAVNVSAIPSELIESELFGYEKGAFTGANTRKIGKFEEASKGTLFLDEIGDMNLNMQSKILRVLQENELTRVGGNLVIKISTRLIIATHKNLADLVREGKFREDLYYRLLGLPIHIPPLRDRDGDVLILARNFINKFCSENNLVSKSLSSTAQEKLKSYHFPGNVRELKSVIELATVLSNTNEIDEADINFGSLGAVEDIFSTELTMKEYYKKIVLYYLNKYDNKVRVVADKLDIGKSSIYNLINE